uniref:Uncharacterized protein n=1 Tax=Ceratitis capitata TaxID=7213 RepID=W8C6G6_CERCA
MKLDLKEEHKFNKSFLEINHMNKCSFERLNYVGWSYSPTTVATTITTTNKTNTTYQKTNNIIDLNSYYANYTNNYGYICEISPKSIADTEDEGKSNSDLREIEVVSNVPQLAWTFRPPKQGENLCGNEATLEERSSGIYEEVNIADLYEGKNKPNQNIDINSLSYKYANDLDDKSSNVSSGNVISSDAYVNVNANANVNANVNCRNVISSMQNAQNLCKLNTTHEIAEDNNYAVILSSCKPLKFSFASEWLV